MPVWLASALAMLRPAGGALVRTVGSGRFLAGTGVGGLATGVLDGADGGGRRRRRRRRALTASDRADIGFIQGLLGPKAAKDFTVTLVAGLSR